MVSNQVIQDCIDDISQIMRVPLCVFDIGGNLVAAGFEADEKIKNALEYFLETPADSQQMANCHFFKLYDGEETVYVVAAKSDTPDAYNAGRLALMQLGRLLDAYRETYDTNEFMQDLLTGNLLVIDMYNRARKLGIEMTAARMVFVIETEYQQDDAVLELVRELYARNGHDFVTAVDENSMILVKETGEKNAQEEAATIATMLVDMINVEAMSRARVSYGNVAEQLKDVERAYKEAKMALEVGKIFYAERPVVAYNMLGIGRLIYQLPSSVCDMFLEEVFREGMPEEIGEETLMTIHMFFEQNLNLSETARQLYIHRNTLAYRLEKVEKATGLDLHSFDGAMTFKLALMVAEYRRNKKETRKS